MFDLAETRDTSYYLRINELKNYAYCPRISYYTLCLDLDRTTRLAELGIEAEQDTRRKVSRRKGALHIVIAGERYFNVPVHCHRLELVGRVDEVVISEGTWYLVDYKDVEKDYGYWKLQMAAYRACVEEMTGSKVGGCYIYSIPQRQYHELALTKREDNKLIDIIDDVQQMVAAERCPSPAAQVGKCRTCQYRRFCNDVQ